jgi:2-dehydro-3-deoxygluconokinase
MRHVDLCITSAEEARTIFGLDVPVDAPDKDERAARALCAEFGFKSVALTARQSSSANETEWGAMLFANGEAHASRRLRVGIVDRLGAGDAFSGALLFSLMRGDAPLRAVEFAVAASALQHTIYGDYNLSTLAEVEALVGGAGGGRVQR